MPSLDTSSAETYLRDVLGLSLPAGWGASVARYHELLVRANKETNLTRLTEPREFLIKHVVDSLLVVAAWPALARGRHHCVDVGCGGGLPGIALALTLPDLELTLVDSAARKIEWVKRFIEELGLRSARAVAGRARELARQHEHAEAYDVVVARAVAETPELIRECRRLPAPGGVILAYKTPRQIEQEDTGVRREAKKAGLGVERSPVLELPLGHGNRQFWVLRRMP